MSTLIMKIDIEPTKKPSVLIRKMIEAGGSLNREIYYPNYTYLHTPSKDRPGVCKVCAAGVLIAHFGNVNPTEPLSWGSPKFGGLLVNSWEWKLTRCMDYIRKGKYFQSLNCLHFESHEKTALNHLIFKLDEVTEPKYGEFYGWDQFDQFLDEMEHIATEFEELELCMKNTDKKTLLANALKNAEKLWG